MKDDGTRNFGKLLFFLITVHFMFVNIYVNNVTFVVIQAHLGPVP